MLKVREPWASLLVDGCKSMEIRGFRCAKPAGTTVYIAPSGTRGVAIGCVEFIKTVGPLSTAEWQQLRSEHRVPTTDRTYGAHTYGWVVARPQRFASPLLYEQKKGAVIWQVA